ncbi:MAG: helix-turn-helix transcriptional regulator [Bacteroidales bacterium]
MIERIRKVLQVKKLTPSLFADKVGVPRSTISHVLSGRNNPSLEFLQKILDNFPEIRTEWLVRGEGSMLKQANTLFDDEEMDGEAASGLDFDKQEPAADRFVNQSPGRGNISGPAPAQEQATESGPVIDFGEQEEKRASEQVIQDKPRIEAPKKSKKTARIMIFYTDGTFQEYLPSEEG